ncbi:GyrI-like domain-containing protein [Rhodococcus sp. IEGM 1408]|uniref:GyrI-like domain-containing protein n=1 Tax=Rhodococcus sp. IEGM 1408 TaxID=3082220 RepID=UPI0029552170|nr:GyrI-like domain-containing protein [Rhodococcus sp. IEGM 1408]MDV8000046.1 GyrI-like domain-containing protein [Rhodococcus sp. IEGM 1408]
MSSSPQSSQSPESPRPPAPSLSPPSPEAAPAGYPDLGADPVVGVRLLAAEAVPTAVVRAANVRMATISDFFDAAFGKAFPALFATGMTPVAAAFALYTRITEGAEAEVDLEIGFPLGTPLPDGSGDEQADDGLRVVPSELPAGEVAVTSYIGPYDGLGEAWGKLMGEIRAMGREPAVPFWESYVTEPSPDMDPTTLRTDLFCVVGYPDDAA